MTVADIRRGIARMDTDGELRTRLAQAGPRQAANFSLENYAGRIESAILQPVAANSIQTFQEQ